MGNFAGFSKVKLQSPTKSHFDLSHFKRLSTRMGRLTPILMQECVPSDYFTGSSEALVRLAPLLAPIYDQIKVYVHYYFVPNRPMWAEWEKFITAGRLGPGSADPAVQPLPPMADLGLLMADDPQMFAKSTLPDYLGVPVLPMTGNAAVDYVGINIDVLPFAAYQWVVKEYYLDRNYTPDDFIYDFPIPTGGVQAVGDVGSLFVIRERSYEHDYFVSALPFTQRGAEVLIPMEGSVQYMDQAKLYNTPDGGVTWAPYGSGNPLIADITTNGVVGTSASAAPWTPGSPLKVENIESVSNIATTINDFRSAYALQVWLERNAVAGSRYTESIQAHFDLKPQDSRLQRPEYIGGGVINVKISEVVSTAYSVNGDDQNVPQANMAGHGITYGNTNQFKYFCPEHGFIIGIMSIMNPPSYHQGMPRMFRRRTFLDYPWPTFAKLGEQQVDKAELFASAENLTEDDDGLLPLFGYQSRYADWKYVPNWNHGDFHDTLLYWTLTRDFADSPVLGDDFIRFDGTTQDRIFAVNGTGDNFWILVNNNVHVKRPLPYFGTPNTLGFS